jgi:hypothetical protein
LHMYIPFLSFFLSPFGLCATNGAAAPRPPLVAGFWGCLYGQRSFCRGCRDECVRYARYYSALVVVFLVGQDDDILRPPFPLSPRYLRGADIRVSNVRYSGAVDVFAIGWMGVDQVEERADQGVQHDFQRQRQICANLSRRTRMPDDFGTAVRVT